MPPIGPTQLESQRYRNLLMLTIQVSLPGQKWAWRARVDRQTGTSSIMTYYCFSHAPDLNDSGWIVYLPITLVVFGLYSRNCISVGIKAWANLTVLWPQTINLCSWRTLGADLSGKYNLEPMWLWWTNRTSLGRRSFIRVFVTISSLISWMDLKLHSSLPGLMVPSTSMTD